MAMETKAIDRFELKSDAEGTFVALVSSFDKPDKYGDVMKRGAFADTIARWRAKGAKVPVVFSHRSDDISQHVGEVDPNQLEETAIGLEARGRFYLDEPIAKKVHLQLQRKALTEWSFGFQITRAKTMASGVRELHAVDLIEIGPTVRGVGDTATITVKSATKPAPTGPLAPYRQRIEHALRRNRIAFTLARSLEV